MDRPALVSVVLALCLVCGMALPAMALSVSGDDPAATLASEPTAQTAVQTTQNDTGTQNGSGVNVTVGPQLSTVIDVSSGEVRTEVENTAFDRSVEGASEEAQAEAIADRAATLSDRAEAIHEAYEEATEAYEDGELTKSEYARQLALLNARASNLLDSYDRLHQRAQTVSTAELDAAGVNRSTLNQSTARLNRVTGTGTSALLRQFTGESDGEIDLTTENGLSIEVESDDGELSREFERLRDDDDSFRVSQTDAFETARSALSSTPDGGWLLTSTESADDDGVYEFEFALANASGLTGEAEVTVDGSSGEIVALEEEIERRDDGETDSEEADGDEADSNEIDSEETNRDEIDDDRELTIVVTAGTPGPNEVITIQVRTNGEPAPNATISLNDQTVGTTDADGTLSVRLPAEETELTAELGDADAELEFDFDEDDED